MPLVKKQHYVPQFYLRHFTTAGERIFVYDKFRQAAFPSNVHDIAASNYFHDLSIETVAELEAHLREEQAKENMKEESVNKLLEQIKDVQMIEKYLSRLENRFERVLSKVIEGLDHRTRFKQEYRSELAQMAAVQFWRTQERREGMMELGEKLKKRLCLLSQN
jgi:hypothetical protein